MCLLRTLMKAQFRYLLLSTETPKTQREKLNRGIHELDNNSGAVMAERLQGLYSSASAVRGEDVVTHEQWRFIEAFATRYELTLRNYDSVAVLDRD
jgi:hypothetical protein